LPTIAKITNGASAQKALDYALGKNQELHNKTEQWLKDNNLQRDVNLQNTRAVALGVTNGIFAESAKEQFKTVRNMYDQRQSKTPYTYGVLDEIRKEYVKLCRQLQK